MSDDDDDQPIMQRLKNVAFLDLVPGYADVYESGQKIMILTLGHNDEVEHPLCLSLKDSWKMAHHLIAALSFHGDTKATAILALFAKDSDNDADIAASAQDFVETHCKPTCERTGQSMDEVRRDPRPFVSPLGTTEMTISVTFEDTTSKQMEMHIIGGYQTARGAKEPAMLMVRSYEFVEGGHDFIVKMADKGTIYLRGHQEAEVMPPPNWASFATQEPGYRFKIGKDGPVWFKMAAREIKQRIGRRRVFRVAEYRG